MLTPSELILIFCVIVALLALGATITVSNERVRAATLQVRDVAREYALADMAMRREQARQSIAYVNSADGLLTLSQIALDVTGEKREFNQLSFAAGAVIAVAARSKDGSEAIFTPSLRAFVEANPQRRGRARRVYAVSGLVSGPFVVEELGELARSLGATALPRTEQWELAVFAPEDYSALGQRGLTRFRRLFIDFNIQMGKLRNDEG